MSSTVSNKAPTFGAQRGKWLDQVLADPKMKGCPFCVMYAITSFLNSNTFTAQHGDIAIAKHSHMSVSTVERAITLAQERGHLEASGNKPRVLKPILKSRQFDGTQSGQIVQIQDESRHESPHESRQTFRGPPVESTGWKGDSQDSQDSQDSHKKEEEEDGLPRGPTAPKEGKEEPISVANLPSPSPPCDVPRAAAEEQARVGKGFADLQKMLRVNKIPPAVTVRRNDGRHSGRIRAELDRRRVRNEMAGVLVNGGGRSTVSVSS
jgi:hypothetical protein